MGRYHSYINSAKEILSIYKGNEPFPSFIKKYFSQYKKHGSKDRKQIAQLCYCYFRSAPPPPKGEINEASSDINEKILTGLFLFSSQPNEILSELKPEWNEQVQLSLKEKLFYLNFQLSSVFPWKNELSEGIDHENFCESFFIQPDLFLRLRSGKKEIVREKLLKARINFKVISDSCLALDNATKVNTIIELDKEAVIKDYNSQNTGKFIESAISNLVAERQDLKSEISLWDCCAGSGGKAIMVYDINPNISLVVSDMRDSIIANLKKRFLQAGIKKYKSYVFDLLKGNTQHFLFNTKYSIIVADVPCSGSGTWGRSPEQLYFFDESKISSFSALQKKLVSKVVSQLQPHGFFIYMTCSVFKKENEEVVEFIKENLGFDLVKAELLKGYDKKADTMFAALLKKSL